MDIKAQPPLKCGYTFYVWTISVLIEFFSALCKRPSCFQVFTVDRRGSAGTFLLVETLGSEAQRQSGLG